MAQWQSASFTRKRLKVRFLQCPYFLKTMTKNLLRKFLSQLETNGYQLVGPKDKEGEIYLEPITAKDFDVGALNKMPLYSFKKFFIPPQQNLLDLSRQSSRPIIESPFLALVGLSVQDFLALNLWRQVFERDVYFEERFKNMILIGLGPATSDEKNFNLWEEGYEENVLEHIQFDIFLLRKGSELEVFTGSRQGQKLLDKFNYKDYEHIQFTGIIKEEGVEKWVKEVYQKLKLMTPQDKLWQDLGRRCIECGKCTIVCPTCFCFDLSDTLIAADKDADLRGQFQRQSASSQRQSAFWRQRCWTSCFYPEFSEIAGQQVFLKTTAEKIYFWYYHKFVRIFEEYAIPGCVGCGRCSKVCPAKININEVLISIRNSDTKNPPPTSAD